MPKLPTAEQVLGKSIHRKPVKTLKVPMSNLIRIQALVNYRIDLIAQVLSSEDLKPAVRRRLEREVQLLQDDLKAICGGK